MDTKARAYSYLRFSSPEQIKGDSFRRQISLSRQYAEKHNLKLDESLTFQDLGISAYRSRNIKEGALGAFIEAYDKGIVRKGSYLLRVLTALAVIKFNKPSVSFLPYLKEVSTSLPFKMAKSTLKNP